MLSDIAHQHVLLSNLFIIQVPYFTRISYKAGKAKQLERCSRCNQPAK